MKVLLVDDDAYNLKMFGRVLHNNGYNVIAAESGEEGLRIAVRDLPNVVIVGFKMARGGMTGIEMIQQLRQHDAIKHTAVVVVNGHKDEVCNSTHADLRLEAFLHEPINFNHLLTTVHNISKPLAKPM